MSRVLAIGDLHAPFVRRGYLEHCLSVYRDLALDTVVLLGDEADNHAISYHDKNPDGYSAGVELSKAKKVLQKWMRAFPVAKVCISNHGSLFYRKAFTHGLPVSALRSYAELWGAPEEWRWETRHVIDGVQYIHGTGFSGPTGALNAAKRSRQSTVIGHIHAHAGITWTASSKDILFGMNVGCGIDHRAYAFDYGRDMPDKPIVGCGFVIDGMPGYAPMKIR